MPRAPSRIANTGNGVQIDGGATGNTIGGITTTPGTGAGNVISGNSDDGVDISGSGTTGNVVAGNLIGTNAAGEGALGNGYNGVEIDTGGAAKHDWRHGDRSPQRDLGKRRRPPRAISVFTSPAPARISTSSWAITSAPMRRGRSHWPMARGAFWSITADRPIPSAERVLPIATWSRETPSPASCSPRPP